MWRSGRGSERSYACSKDRLADRNIAARAEHDHVAVRVLGAEDQEVGCEARDVLRTKIADAQYQRAEQRRRLIVRDLRARPHDPVGTDVDADLVGRMAGAGKRLDVHDLADPDVETGEIAVGVLRFQRRHLLLTTYVLPSRSAPAIPIKSLT